MIVVAGLGTVLFSSALPAKVAFVVIVFTLAFVEPPLISIILAGDMLRLPKSRARWGKKAAVVTLILLCWWPLGFNLLRSSVPAFVAYGALAVLAGLMLAIVVLSSGRENGSRGTSGVFLRRNAGRR